MNIDAVDFDPYDSIIDQMNNVQPVRVISNDKSKPGQRDSYIPSTASLAAELGLPTSNYNSMGIMEDFLPVSAVEADNKVNTDSFVTEMSK